jgi:splicing factor 45
MSAPPPKRGRLSLYEDKISDESRAEIKARDDARLAAAESQKKKDGIVLS